MSSESSRLSRSWIQKLLLMQQDVFPFGAGDTWQHAAGAVAAFAMQVGQVLGFVACKQI